MKFHIIALIGVFICCHQVYGQECDSLEKLTNDEDFNECVLSGVWTKPLLYGEKYDVDTNEDCEWMVSVLPKVKQFIESGSDADVIRDQFQLELCASLTSPDKKQLCMDLSDKYYKRVIVLLFLGVPNERISGLLGVCNQIGSMCDNAYDVCQNLKSAKSCGRTLQCTKYMWTTPDFVKTVSDFKDDSWMCTECVMFLKEIQEVMANGTTRQEIIDYADNICERFFSVETCEEDIEIISGEIIMALENDAMPQVLCYLMGMCQVTSNEKDNYDDCSLNLSTLCQDPKHAEWCGRTQECEELRWTTPDFVKTVSDLKDGSWMCTECEMFVKEMQELLDNGATRQEIIDYADNICDRFFSLDDCEEYVGEVIGEILMLLENDVTPDEVCDLMEVCKDTSNQEEKNNYDCSVNLSTLCQNPKHAEACDLVKVCDDVRSYTADQESMSDDVICEGCEALMATVKEYLANDEVVEYIEQEADLLCQYCPEQQACEEAIKTYLPQIIALIQNYLNPVGICTEMGLCGQNVSAITNHLLKPDQFRPEPPVEAQRCPNGEDCGDDETCCRIGSGSYGCCPMPNAVCCSDMIHCCPSGYTCQENYCMRSSAEEYPGFDFAFFVDVQANTMPLYRPRRQVEEETFVISSSESQMPTLQMLMNMGQMFLSQMNTKASEGACIACNLVMKHRLYEMPLDQDFTSYVAGLEETVCKEATEKGVECPSIAGIEAILEAAKDAPAGSECPIEELCSGSPLDGLSMKLDDVMCLLFENMMSRLEDDQSWTEMEEKILELGEKAPKVQKLLVQTMNKSKEMYGTSDAASKMEIIRQQMYNYVPELKKCEKPKEE